MASSCFRLEATRGPHSGVVASYCHVEAAAASLESPKSSELSIGRKKRCWLRLPKDLEVSSAHAEFRFVEGGKRVAIRDSKSTNGTKLNGNPLKPHQNYQLSTGDLVTVGKTSLRFVQIVHGQPCGKEAEDNSTTTTANDSGLMPSVSSPVAKVAGAPEVIVLDTDSEKDFSVVTASASVAVNVPSGVGATETPVEQPDTEPGLDEEPVRNEAAIDVNDKKIPKAEGGAELNVEAATTRRKRTGAVHGHTPEEATCIVCSAVIGQLDLLEQQAHLNECLGGRFAQLSGKAAPKSKKRGNAGDSATRAKKPRKPKASSDADSAPKVRKPRKRKRATDAGEDIELALALAGKTKLSKEEQTDAQLAVTKKKLEQLDEQMAKLVKRRANLVKTLDRLERTKEKLRKSQVLPPSKVLQLLDLKAALASIFPSNRQAQPADRFANNQLMSAVAKKYIPSRWNDTEGAIDCDNEKHVELAAVAAISMWARASQQLFGLRRDTLLYRNSVLRGFLGDDEDLGSSINADNLGDEENEDGDDGIDYEPGQELADKLKPIASDHEVPDVVKRVFLNWQRDLAFLHEQTAGELEMALEAMNEAQAQADTTDEASHPGNEDPGALKTDVAVSESILLAREEQRLACKYMAQVMMKLIDKKKRHADVVEYGEEFQQQDLVVLSGEEVGKPQQDVDVVAASDSDAEMDSQLPVLQKAAAFAAEECIKLEQKVFLDANSSAELHSMQ